MDVHWRDADGKLQEVKAVLDNVSTSGAGLFLPAPVPLDTELHWYRPRLQQSFWGRVRYCFPKRNGYLVGVELEPACKASDNRIMRHENLSPGQKIQARVQRCDLWTNWVVFSATESVVTLRADAAEFVGFRQPDGALEDAGGRRIELRQPM